MTLCGGRLAGWKKKVKKRLPGGEMFRDLFDWGGGPRFGREVTAAWRRRSLRVYFLGGRRVGNRPVRAIREEIPPLYHFTPSENEAALLREGILPRKGWVFLTDRGRDASWLGLFRAYKKTNSLSRFQIDGERLRAQGHEIQIMERRHEYVTDSVPADCIRLTGGGF